MPLTDAEIKRARRAEKPYKLSDSRILYLWVTRSVANYDAGRIGMKVSEAHDLRQLSRCTTRAGPERHDAARKLLAASVDPTAERKRRRPRWPGTSPARIVSVPTTVLGMV
jgi:hypothetical protein